MFLFGVKCCLYMYLNTYIPKTFPKGIANLRRVKNPVTLHLKKSR